MCDFRSSRSSSQRWHLCTVLCANSVLGEGAYYTNERRDPLHLNSAETQISNAYLVATSACLQVLDFAVTDARLRVFGPIRDARASQMFQSR